MFPVPIIVNQFSPHQTVKSIILDLIDKGDYKPLDTLVEQISKTDWSRENNKDYQKVILPHIIETVRPIFGSMNYRSFNETHIWFQQYVSQDFHGWHRHPETDWGFVYYIELPDDGPPTEFRNPLDQNETFLPSVKEGDFILFPTFLEHRSNENNSTKRKTVIVTNFKTF